MSVVGEDWIPSTGWSPAPHHMASKRLWERIQQEARDDAVRTVPAHALSLDLGSVGVCLGTHHAASC